MKKLHLLVIKSFLGPLILTFFFVVFILLMQFLWKYIDDLIGKGLEFGVIGEFLVYTSATLVPLAIPLSVLLASLMTFGNLAENLELLAFKSSGISLVRIMNPVIILSSLIAISAFVFSNTILPYSNLKMRSLLYDIQQQRPELTIKPGVFDNNLEGYSIRIGDRDPKTHLLKDILIFDHTEKHGNTNVTIADSGYMKMSADEKHLLLTLYNGKSYVEMQKEKKEDRHVKSYPLRRDYFDKREILIEMTGFGLNRSDDNLFRNSYSMLNLNQLHHFNDSLSQDLDEILDKFWGTLDKGLTAKSKQVLINRTPPSVHKPGSPMHEKPGPGISKSELQARKAVTRPGAQANKTVPQPKERSNKTVPQPEDKSNKTRIQPETETEEAATPPALQEAQRTTETGPDSIPPADTLPNSMRIATVFGDSLYTELDKAGKHRAITQAISFARSNKSVISSNLGTAEWKTSRLRRYQIEIQRKYTYSLLCLIFFFIGAPLGAIIRKGGLGMPVIASVLMFLFYYVISMTGEKFAREDVLSPFMGMWLSTFILVPISIWLTYTAVNDSVILNIETYFTWFKKLRERLTPGDKHK